VVEQFVGARDESVPVRAAVVNGPKPLARPELEPVQPVA
jgi:hypothetical protein